MTGSLPGLIHLVVATRKFENILNDALLSQDVFKEKIILQGLAVDRLGNIQFQPFEFGGEGEILMIPVVEQRFYARNGRGSR